MEQDLNLISLNSHESSALELDLFSYCSSYALLGRDLHLSLWQVSLEVWEGTRISDQLGFLWQNTSLKSSSAFPSSFSGKVVKREMFFCTFVYNKINLRDERRLGLILSFMFRQLEGEFVSLPVLQTIRVLYQSCLAGMWCSQPVWHVLFLFLHLSIEGKNHQLCFSRWYSVVLLVPWRCFVWREVLMIYLCSAWKDKSVFQLLLVAFVFVYKENWGKTRCRSSPWMGKVIHV